MNDPIKIYRDHIKRAKNNIDLAITSGGLKILKEHGARGQIELLTSINGALNDITTSIDKVKKEINAT